MHIKLSISNHPKSGFKFEFQYKWKPKKRKRLKKLKLLAWASKLFGLN